MKSNKYQKVIITAGISLFGGYNAFRQWADTLNIFRYDRTNPLPADGMDEAISLEKWVVG